MSLKLINTIGDTDVITKTYKDSQWNEYVTKTTVKGVLEKSARWNHTDDKNDALDTAKYIYDWNVKEMKKSTKKPVQKRSAKAILESLETKTRKINPVKKVTRKANPAKSYIVLKIRAPNDVNGAPRKGWLIWHDSGKFQDFIAIGYKSDNDALLPYSQTHKIIDLGLIDVTTTVYNQAKKSGIVA